MIAGKTGRRKQIDEENPDGKGLYVVGLTSESKGENIHPKQFARRAIF